MVKKNRIAIIPARSGSKGIPNKNIYKLIGRPLIDYTIKAALESNCFERVIVSTDCKKIAKIAEECGAEVPFLRPESLAGDTAKSIDAVLDVLDRLADKYQTCCLLQPTAPLRSAEDIQAAIQSFESSGKDALVSVSRFEEPHPYKLKIIEAGNLKPFINGKESEVPRQLLPQCYCLNGAIYLNKVKFLEENRTFFAKETEAFLMPEERSVNIDTKLDLILAEVLLKSRV